jgi:hypothetical protein
VAGAERTTFGVAAGKGASTTSVVPLSGGVVGPHAGVYSVTGERDGGALRVNGRYWPVPCQEPSRATRSTCNFPPESNPAADRPPIVPALRKPLRITMLDGEPHLASKKSPLMPTTVVWPETSFSMSVSRSRPWTAPFERAARSE